jgi:Mg2+/Co2+ transporter CorB
MNVITEAWLWLLMMGVLLVFSALFSGSEAALFSLNHRARKALERASTGGRIASRLLDEPERLLSALLFWNLLVNMTYFAIAAIVGAKLEQDPAAGPSVAIAFTVISLLVVIFFSEMLPKSVAVLAPAQFAVLCGPPLMIAVRIISPVLPLVSVINLAVRRLIWPNFQPEPEIELADIERAIEFGTDDAALLNREKLALRGLVEMAETRISELMRPRNKLWFCKDPSDRSVIAGGMPPGGYLMVIDSEGMITKAIGVRMLRPSQFDDLETACEPVIYVPWSALASQVLDQLKEEGLSVAVVVNEFGELIGAATIDGILRRTLDPKHHDVLVGDTGTQEAPAEVYRVSGTASIRNLAKRLNIEFALEGITTVAGYIQRHNERLPRLGDSAPMDGYVLTVIEQDDDVSWIDVRRQEQTAEGQA